MVLPRPRYRRYRHGRRNHHSAQSRIGGQDFRIFKWPEDLSEVVFEVKEEGTGYGCKADGYGHLKSEGDPGDYGNGRVFVLSKEDVLLAQEGPLVIMTEGDFKEVCQEMAEDGFNRGYQCGVELIRMVAETHDEQKNFLLYIAELMEVCAKKGADE